MGTEYKKGLSQEEVLESRRLHGDNVLTPPAKEPLWKQFIEKFTDPIIRILLIALVLSVAVSVYQYATGMEGLSVLLEPLGIFIAVMLATTVAFFFELNANKKFEILNQVRDEGKVTVFRDGVITQIERKNVVVGDWVVVETGDEIPADGYLHEAVSLMVDESQLTGEPVARKSVHPEEFNSEATYPTNYVCRGCAVLEGHGIFIVDKVGDATEWGKVYQGAQIDNKVRTPLNEQLDELGHVITVASYVIAGFVIVLRLVMYFAFGDNMPFDWMDFVRFTLNTLMIAVTLIVVAVPEGLPMSVTLSLAMSMKRMLETNNLVRKLHACETMGAATVICTDKTGTLTQNQMCVDTFHIFALPDGKLDESEASHLIKEGIALNSTAYLDFTDREHAKPVGNPTEAALLLWLYHNNVDYISLRDDERVVRQWPFSPKYKYMATLVKTELSGERVLYVKGAPEIVMKHCSSILLPEGEKTLEDKKAGIDSELLSYQHHAMRTLAFAYKYLSDNEIESIYEGEKMQVDDLCLLGVCAISDPIRLDVPDAVKACNNAGIKVKIVTGDTSGIAMEIGRKIGLWQEDDTEEENIVTGKEFSRISDEEMLSRLDSIKIMSRARPSDKERLVKLLQQHGEVVAVTGDGTNDAPALNAAQIGLSMGDGTSVAKEASDITIIDNSFKSIARAVTWGRSLYHNIQRFILFQMTINVAACLVVLMGALLGTESPLTVTQMLWVNLVMDTFAALALASLPPDSDVMKEKPRSRDAFIINKDMWRKIFGVGLSFVVVLFGFLQYFKHFDVTSFNDFSLRDYFSSFVNFSHVNKGLSPYELTLFFTIFVFMQFWNIFNAKAYHSEKSAFADLCHSSGFLWTLALVFIGQILIVTLGGEMFEVVPLAISDWVWVVCATSLILWIGEAGRAIKRMRANK